MNLKTRERRRPRLEEVAPFLASVVIERYLCDGNITRTARDVMLNRELVRTVLIRHFGTMANARIAFLNCHVSRLMREFEAKATAPTPPP